jgi:hypothetical protein
MWKSFQIDHPLTFENNAPLVDYLNSLYEVAIKEKSSFLTKHTMNIFSIQQGSNMVTINPPRHSAMIMTSALPYLLGLTKQPSYFSETKSPITMDVFGDLISIYVYCNIIEMGPVDDKMAQLLRVVMIDRSGRKGIIHMVSFPQLQFFPMRSNSIHTVGIYLRDHAGQKVPFLREVIVSLLIRPNGIVRKPSTL